MTEEERTPLDVLNHAAHKIGGQLFQAGSERVPEYIERYGIRESDVPLVLANAFLRVCALTNASVFGLDANELAVRLSETIRSFGTSQPW